MSMDRNILLLNVRKNDSSKYVCVGNDIRKLVDDMRIVMRIVKSFLANSNIDHRKTNAHFGVFSRFVS